VIPDTHEMKVCFQILYHPIPTIASLGWLCLQICTVAVLVQGVSEVFPIYACCIHEF